MAVLNFASSTEDRASGSQIIEGSVKINSALNARLERTPSSAGNRMVYTISVWCKNTLTSSGSQYIFDAKGPTGVNGENPLCFDSGRLRHSFNNGSDIWDRTSTKYFRDTGWYHVVASVDMTLATQDDRVRTFVNGVRVTDFTQPTNFRPNQNSEAAINDDGVIHAIGWWINGSSREYDGYLSQFHLIDGSALEPTDFGFHDPLTNTWRPKKFTKDIPNQKGRTFSSTVTASSNSWGGGAGPEKAFNGSLGDGFNNGSGGQWITFDTSSYNLSGNVRCYCYSSSGVYDIYINGNSTKVADTPSSYAWVDCGTHDVINEIQWAGTAYGGNNGLGSAGVYVAAIIVDGVWLRDNMHEYGNHGFFLPLDGNTPVGQDHSGLGNNFQTIWLQGGNTIDKATGAFPILNTVSGGQSAAPGTRGSFTDKTITVASSKFVVDGTSQSPMHLLRGGTYKFDQSNSSNAGHPLRFSTTDNGTHGGGSEYTDGVISNGFPRSATDYGVEFDGSDGLTCTITGGTGAGDFTIEYWVKHNTLTDWQTHLSCTRGSTGFNVGTDASGDVVWYDQVGSTGRKIEVIGAITTDRWYHWAFVRSGGVIKAYLDGVALAKYNATWNWSAGSWSIGCLDGSSEYINGAMSNVRVVIGTAVYTSNFTVTSAPLTNITNTKVLCCQSGTPTASTGASLTAVGDATSFALDGTKLHGAYTKVTVPHNAPDKLYYYCVQHSGMGGDVSNSTDIRKADPYAWKCVTAVPLAHDFIDVTDRVNCTATEKTTTATSVNRSTNNYHFYHGCTIFNGSSGNGGFKIHHHPEMNLGNRPFTLECWFWSESNSSDLRTIWSSSGYMGSGSIDSFNFYLYDNGWKFYNRVGGSFTLMTEETMVWDRFEWNHLAWVREGTGSNENKIYINGSKIVEFTNSADYDIDQHIYLGANDYNTNYPEYEHNGFIQDFRMYEGVAKYTSDFIPASPDPGVQKQSPSGISYKTELKKSTEGSVTFGVSAASHSIKLGAQSDFSFGTGDFCIEGFFYINILDGAVGHLIDFRPNGTDGLYPMLRHQGSTLQCALDTSSGNLLSISNAVTGQRWCHIAFTRAGTAVKLFVNGKVVGTATSSSNVGVGANRPMIGGSGYHETSLGHRGWISNVRIVKGSAVYTAEFTPPTEPLKNITNTKLLCCQSNNSPADYTVSPGTITVTGAKTKACSFNPFNDDVDSATAKASGVAYLSAFDQHSTNDVTFNEGGLKYSIDSTDKQGFGNIWIPLEGKWYWEVTLEVIGSGRTGLKAVDNYEKWNGDSITYLSYDGAIRKGPSDTQTQSGLGNTVNGNTIGFKVDRDNNTVQFVRNGCEIGNAETLTTGVYYKPTVARNSSGGSTPVGEFNFGQKPFKYPQDGFQPLTLANLPRTKFPRPDQYFKPVEWTGTTAKDIQVDVGFRPDLVICKSKTQNYGWYWYDSVRGGNLGSGTVPVGEKQCYRAISSNMNAAESDETSTQNGIVLNSNGFMVDKDGQALGEAGQGNLNMIGYCWKAGGFSNTYNIDGVGYSSWSDTGLTATSDITPTGMSLGTKQGFNIIGYTGVGGHPKYLNHHLGAVPGLVIIKNRTYARNWAVKFPKHMAGGQRLELQDSGGYNNEGPGSGGLWNATNPDATKLTFSDYNMTNGNGDSMIAYIWIDVEGLQKFGTYKGNQSSGGPFVHCGFRPALVWIKRAGSGKWNVADATRNPSEGPHGRDLELNTNNAPESYASDNYIDIVSNGFKIRSGNETEHNGNGETYHYAAWSAQSMHNLYGAQSDAR